MESIEMSVIEEENTVYEKEPSFYLNFNSTLPIDKELYKANPYIYIICLKNNISEPEKISEAITYYLSKDDIDINKYANFFTMVQFPMKVLYKNNINRGLIKIKASYLTLFNSSAYLLKDEVYIYLMLNVKEYIVKNFLENYVNHLDKFIETKLFTTYFGIKNSMNNYLTNLINSIDYNKYWQYPRKSNINQIFKDRLFNLPLNSDTDNLISNNFVDYNNKAKIIFQQSYFFLEDNDLKFTVNIKNKYRYKVNSKKIPDIAKEVEFLLTQNILSEKERYYLLCNMLINNLYCHLIVTNALILEKNQDIFIKYQPIFRYLFSYVWSTLVNEERETRTFIVPEDRFIFTIDAASNLPYFPFSLDNIKNYPYANINVSDTLIDNNHNAFGIKAIVGDKNTIVNLETLKRRMNIFITGKEDDCLIDKMDFSNSVITGSIMAATLPSLNPLMHLCNADKAKFEHAETLNQYYDMFYKDADVDVACHFSNIIDFINFVTDLRNTIVTHYNTNLSEVVIEPIKYTILFVDDNILKRKCQAGEIPFDYDFIIDNKNDMSVKLYFYELYLEEKKKINVDLRKKLGTNISNPLYFELFSYCKIDKIKLIITNSNKNVDDYLQDQPFVTLDGGSVYIKYNESLKFKLKTKYLSRSLEIFNSKLKALSLIAKFHFSCVKAFYNGKNCYLLPSSITAHTTFINFGLNYFVGSKNPIDLINKYRFRGFSILLNEKEYKVYTKYNQNNSTYKHYIDNMQGPLELHNPLYLSVVAKKYVLNPSYNVSERYVDKEAYSKYWKDNFPSLSPLFIEYNATDVDGNNNPMKYWLIDAIYDLLK